MSMPLLTGQNAAVSSHQHHRSHGEQKGDNATQPLVKFNSRNVNKQVIYQFLSDKDYGEVKVLSEMMCNAASKARGGDWNKTNLKHEFVKHGLKFDCSHHTGLNSDKCRAVLNLLLDIQNEARANGKLLSTDGSSVERSLADRFCSLLKDAKSVFTGGKDHLFDVITLSSNESATDTVHDNGASVDGNHGSQALSRLSRDSGSTVKLPAPWGDAPNSSASAPPNYDAVQIENMHTRLMNLNSTISSMLNGLNQDHQRQEFITTLNWANEEIQRIRNEFSWGQLENFQVKGMFDQVDNDFRVLNEKFKEKRLVKSFHDQFEALKKKIDEVETKQQNSFCEVDTLIQNLEEINEDVLKLRFVDSEKKSLEKGIREWKTQLKASREIQNVAGKLGEFEYVKTPDHVNSCSKHLEELDAFIQQLPTSSRKTRLLKRASELRSQFENFRQSVSKQHSASKLTDIEFALQRAKAIIETSEKDKNPSESHLSEANNILIVVRNELAHSTGVDIETNREGLLTIFGDLQTRLDRLRASKTKSLEQATAVEITPPVGNAQVHPSQVITVKEKENADRMPPEQPGIKQAVNAVNKSLQNYQGSLTNNSALNTLGSLADVLLKISLDHQDDNSNHQDSVTPGASFNKVAPESGRTHPPRSAIAPSTPLATLADRLERRQSEFYSDSYIATSIAVQTSDSAIIPVHSSAEIPFSQLPESLKRRMKAACVACNGQQPEMITLSQVTLIANNPQAFDHGHFKIALNSKINAKYQQKLQCGPAGSQYSPIGINVSLPKDLKHNADFHRTSWSAHETGVDDVTYFAFGTAGKGSYLQHIGYVQLQDIIKAAGGSVDQASSNEAGVLIPYGVQIKRQSDRILQQIKQSGTLSTDSILPGLGSFHLPSNVVRDGGVDEVDGAIDSGIVPVALNHQTTYKFSRCALANEVLVDKAGLLCVRIVTGLDNVKNKEALEQWITKKMTSIDLNKMSTM